MNKRIAVYPGSFDPFTIGHESIVLRSLELFDEVIVALGINEGKKRSSSPDDEMRRIERYFADQPRVKVQSYQGLTVDFVQETGGCVIIRGIRDLKDFEYERAIADVNRRLSGMETIYFNTEPSLSHVSSSVVRELKRFGKEVSDFLPTEK